MIFSYNIAALIIGFMSGMTLLLTANTMNFWLASEGVSKTSIGIFSLISIPYAISFIWSPILDHLRIPILHKYFGLRFSWVVLLQILLSIFVDLLGSSCPTSDIMSFAYLAFAVAFLSSTQDIALGAFRAEIIPANIQASTSGTYIFGYRMGMLLASSGAIYASIHFSWEQIYGFFSSLILYFPIMLYLLTYNLQLHASRNYIESDSEISKYVSISFWKNALKSMGSRSMVLVILVFLILYRIPDNFISVMINPFLLETGFDAFEISTIGKFLGIVTAIIGGMLASYSMKRMKPLNAMLYFGIIHAFSHLLFIWQNQIGDSIYVLFVVIGLESLSGGMVMASYIAFIMSLCRGKYSATQYAFLTSTMGISRSIFPSISGIIVTEYGWNLFFLLITLLTIPPLAIAYYLRRN